jgi:hypothetical protein
MAGGKPVNANVLVFDDTTGQATFIKAGTVPPANVLDQLGEHLFTGVDVGDDEVVDLGPPPQSGRGSGLEKWQAYAAGKVEVTPDMQRDDIIVALRAAGVDVGDDEQ